MRLFVSYARVDKPYCIQIVDMLDIHDTWYDQRLYAGQNWWKEILRRLEWCEGFVYLLSPESVNSEYCRREFELAQSLQKHIIPVLVHPDTEIPESLQGIQHADLSQGPNVETVKILLNALHIAETQHMRKMPMQLVPEEEIQAPDVDPSHVIPMAVKAFSDGQYDQAVFLLKQAQKNGYHSEFINIAAILAEAENALEQQARRRKADREYRQIRALVLSTSTKRFGCEAFQAYRQVYPDHDPDNLAAHCTPDSVVTTRPTLPLLSWIPIPGGKVNFRYLDEHKRQHILEFNVQDFKISKYPITNAQFQLFIDDPNGYANPQWWDFSPHAKAWREKYHRPQPSSFRGDERPREMVCWYEAMAFSQWLGDKLDLTISLPTIAEWQRAFQGDTNNEYPWGNTYDPQCCNTKENDLKMTTLVNAFEKGASPYGVCDMAGNVWEWCLNMGYSHDFDPVPTKAGERMVRGGSFIGPSTRATVGFHYALNPEAHYATTGFRVVIT